MSTIAGKMTILMCCPGPLARHIMHAWLIPPGGLESVIVSNALAEAILGLAEQLGHRRIHSGGSDSSTGSTTPMDSDLDSADEETTVEKVRTSFGKSNLPARIFYRELRVVIAQNPNERE